MICALCGWPHNVINERCEDCAGLPMASTEPPYMIAAFRRAVRLLLGLPAGATDQEMVDQLMSTSAEATLWRTFREERERTDIKPRGAPPHGPECEQCHGTGLVARPAICPRCSGSGRPT